MSQPVPIQKFGLNLLRTQVPIDNQYPNGEAVIIELVPLDSSEKVWFMASPAECIELGRGLIAEGELARTGIVIPSNW